MTNQLTPAQQAQQHNRTADGKYTTKTHSEADIDLGLENAQEPRIDSKGNDWGPVFDRFENPKRGERIELGYLGYDDYHHEDYIDAQLSGDLLQLDDLADHDEIAWTETVEVRSFVDHELQQHGIDPDEATEEALYDELMDAVTNSPAAVSLMELMEENTPPQLMRMEVSDGENLTDANEDAYYDDDAKVEVMKAKFAELGLDPNTEANAEAIETMVLNGPEYWHDGVSLDVIWSGKYTDAVPADSQKTLTLKDPHFVLIDSFNGSGWEGQAEGTIKRTIGMRGEGVELPRSQRAYLDSRAGGYGWQSIAGVTPSAYDTAVTVEQADNEA